MSTHNLYLEQKQEKYRVCVCFFFSFFFFFFFFFSVFTAERKICILHVHGMSSKCYRRRLFSVALVVSG